MPSHPSTAELFRHDLSGGAIRREDQRRVLAVSQVLVQALHFSLVDIVGEDAADVLYRTGYEWALQDMLQLHRRMTDEFGGAKFDFWQTDPKFVFDAWWAPLESAGWGTLAADFTLRPGLAHFEVRRSVVADALAGSDQPVCHLYAGQLAGVFSFFSRQERHVAEIECVAMGHEVCRFIAGPGAEIDAAETWRQQGIAAAEI